MSETLGNDPALAGLLAGVVDDPDTEPGCAIGVSRDGEVVATATVAAYASLGGLGRYLIDGIKVRQFYLALVGALLVTALALLLDGLLALVVWSSMPGSGRFRRRMPQPLLDDEVRVDTGTRSRTPDYSGEQPSLTVEGW